MRIVLVCVAVVGLVHAGPAAAQEDEIDRARRLHDEGLELLHALRFADARDRFRASLEASPGIGAAFNLGLALRGTGEARAAVDIWTRLLADELGELSAEQRAQVEALVEEVRPLIGTLHLRIQGPPRASLRIDGESSGEVERDDTRALMLDPGRHVLTLRAPGHETAERTVVLNRGEDTPLTLALEPLDTGGGVFTSPWFWTAVGVVVVGALTAVLVVATGPHYGDPVSQPPFGTVATLKTLP
jgi:hypothetical protein